MIGHIKIDRKILNWEWYTDVKMFHLFLYLLLKANFKDGRWQGTLVKRGQLITGRLRISKDTGLTERQIRTCLEKLKTTNEIAIETTNHYSIITICKYDVYQNQSKESDQQIDQQEVQRTTNERPTNDQRTTTIEEELIRNKKGNDDFQKNNFVCYDVEKFILRNSLYFDKICIATLKGADEVKIELHNYHLWLEKKEKYPTTERAALAGIESWILNAKNYKSKYNGNGQDLPISNSMPLNLKKLGH